MRLFSDNTSQDTFPVPTLYNDDVRSCRHSRVWKLHNTYALWYWNIPAGSLQMFCVTAAFLFPLWTAMQIEIYTPPWFNTTCSDAQYNGGYSPQIQIRSFPHNRNGSTALPSIAGLLFPENVRTVFYRWSPSDTWRSLLWTALVELIQNSGHDHLHHIQINER